jgi:transcription elongation factor GreA
MKRKPLTAKGAEKLRIELRRLKTQERPRIIQAIAEARAHGDLSENAEYHAAREQQGFVEGRIKHLEHDLSHCEIIDVAHLPQTGRVVFGATVHLEDQDDGSEVVFQIVGEPEADVRLGLISITSPIARALVGKVEGDVVDVAVPGGTRALEIVAVRYV